MSPVPLLSPQSSADACVSIQLRSHLSTYIRNITEIKRTEVKVSHGLGSRETLECESERASERVSVRRLCAFQRRTARDFNGSAPVSGFIYAAGLSGSKSRHYTDIFKEFF
ncbi:uncharacterized [Tachysurus ichikawai]